MNDSKFATVTVTFKLLAAVFGLLGTTASLGLAQSTGLTANLGGSSQSGVPTNKYTLIKFNTIRYNTLGSGAFVSTPVDSYFIAPRTGIVHFSGQVMVVLDSSQPAVNQGSYVVKIFKNAPCSEDPKQTLIAGIGGGSFWWVQSIQIDGDDLALAGDIYRWCLYSTSTDGGWGMSYIDGNPAHTRIHISMDPSER